MRKEKIAVLGDSDITLAFKAIGMDVYNANSVGEASEKLRLLARNYSVIFITSNGTTGYGVQNIKKDVEKAVGTDILFKD